MAHCRAISCKMQYSFWSHFFSYLPMGWWVLKEWSLPEFRPGSTAVVLFPIPLLPAQENGRWAFLILIYVSALEKTKKRLRPWAYVYGIHWTNKQVRSWLYLVYVYIVHVSLSCRCLHWRKVNDEDSVRFMRRWLFFFIFQDEFILNIIYQKLIFLNLHFKKKKIGLTHEIVF